jgi:hypothetical protein
MRWWFQAGAQPVTSKNNLHTCKMIKQFPAFPVSNVLTFPFQKSAATQCQFQDLVVFRSS